MKLHKLASMLASTSIAFSAFADDHGEKDYLSPFNVIGTKADVQTLKGSGTVLDTTDLEKFNYTDIHEILRQVPGVYVRGEEGYGFFPNISLRGVDPTRSRKTTIMEDGIPSEPSPYADPSAYYAPTAGRMAGFEVLKGSSSLKHGPNNIGGVINYLSTPIPGDKKSYLRASYGEHNERISHAYSGGTTSLGGGTLGYLLEVFDHRSDGWKTIEGQRNGTEQEPSRNAPIAKTDLMLKIGYEFAGGDYLEFKAGRMDMDADVSYQGVGIEHFNQNPYQRYVATDADNMDAEQQRYYLRYIKELSEDITLTSTAYYNEFRRNWYKLHSSGYGPATSVTGTTSTGYSYVNNPISTFDRLRGVAASPALDYKGKSNNRVYETKGIQANLDWEMGNHDLDIGFRFQDDEYYKLDYRNPTYTWGADTNGDGYADSISYAANLASGGTYQDAEALDLYLVDQFSMGALTLTPGIRYTSVDYDYKKGQSSHATKSLSNTLLGIGAGYKLSETMSLFAGVHQGQALPSAEAAADEGNIEENSLATEIGIRGNVNKLYYEVVYFNTQLENMLFLASNANNLASSLNSGEGSTDGFEVLVATDLGSEGMGIPVSISATFTDTEFENGFDPNSYSGGASDLAKQQWWLANSKGKQFPYIADTLINLRGGLEFEKLSTYLNYHWQDSVFTNELNDHELDAYGVLDWSAFYDITENVTVFGKVTNLTDEVYAHSILPGGYRPGQPQSWSLGMEFDF